MGVAISFNGTHWAVRLLNGKMRSLHVENLKTPGGIWRTNGFETPDAGTQSIVETLSRINHACVPNVQKLRSWNTGEFVVIAKRTSAKEMSCLLTTAFRLGQSVREENGWKGSGISFVAAMHAKRDGRRNQKM